MTDLRKSANRMNFGELAEDVMQEHMGFDVGQVREPKKKVEKSFDKALYQPVN